MAHLHQRSKHIYMIENIVEEFFQAFAGITTC